MLPKFLKKMHETEKILVHGGDGGALPFGSANDAVSTHCCNGNYVTYCLFLVCREDVWWLLVRMPRWVDRKSSHRMYPSFIVRAHAQMGEQEVLSLDVSIHHSSRAHAQMGGPEILSPDVSVRHSSTTVNNHTLSDMFTLFVLPLPNFTARQRSGGKVMFSRYLSLGTWSLPWPRPYVLSKGSKASLLPCSF